MHPFVNKNRRLIFWWSAKCGCTTVKSMMLESIVFDHVSEHTPASEDEVFSSLARLLKGESAVSDVDKVIGRFLANNFVKGIHSHLAGPTLLLKLNVAAEFTNVLFVRDPLKRFVSGVVDKHIEGSFSHVYKPASFLDAARNIRMLDKHHFSPQASNAYLPELKYDRVFDIERIDYDYLSGLLGIGVRPRVMNKKNEFSGPCEGGLAEASYSHLAELKATSRLPEHECFYNEESMKLVKSYYEADFGLMQRWLPLSDA